MASSSTRRQLEEWLKTTRAVGRVIDFGGSQNPISSSRVPDWRVTDHIVVDLEQPHETKRAPDVIFDLNAIQPRAAHLKELVDGEYDMAYCIEVSEYWWHPYRALMNIRSVMKKGGTLYISFHTTYPDHRPLGEDCLRYTLNGIVKLLTACGFMPEEITPRQAADRAAIDSFYALEGFRGINDATRYNIGYLVTAKAI